MNPLLAALDRLPPWQVRLLALDGREPMTTRQLSAKSGLSRATIKALARANSWYSFELSTIVKFTDACGIDLVCQKRARQKLAQLMRAARGPAHLRTPMRRYWQSILTGEKEWRKPTQ
jgi:hypothetical protein